MADVVEFSLGPDNPDYVVYVQAPGQAPTGRGEQLVSGKGEAVVEAAQQSFEKAFDRLQPMLDVLATKIRATVVRPDTVTVEFGITLSAKVGAVIASTDAETNFKVTLAWSGQPQQDDLPQQEK